MGRVSVISIIPSSPSSIMQYTTLRGVFLGGLYGEHVF
jgi:hypothetical protein